MATVRINVVRLSAPDPDTWAGSPKNGRIPFSVPQRGETIATTGSSQASGITGDIRSGDIWDVTVTGGNVWIQAGANPVATAGSDFLMLDGQTRQFSVTGNAEKLAAINAT